MQEYTGIAVICIVLYKYWCLWEVTRYTLICLAFHLPYITVALGFMLLYRLINDAVPVT